MRLRGRHRGRPISAAASEPAVALWRTRSVAVAAATNTVGLLPMFLLGALAVLIRAEMGFSETQLGAAVSLFVAVGGVGSIPAGRIAQRMGPFHAMSAVAIVAGGALLGIAALTTTYHQLLVWTALGGAANALAQPSTSLAIAGAIPPRRQGFAFGIMQSAGPGASMLAGLAVPVIGLTVGWRWAYAAAAAAAFAVAAAVSPGRLDRVAMRTRPAAIESGMAALVVQAVAVGLASAAIASMTAFYVESAVDRGIAAGPAGIWFAIGSVTCIAARVGSGWLIDRREAGGLPAVALLMASGAVGFALLAHAGGAALLAIGTVLAFGAGWGWVGLFQFAVVRQHPTAAAAAIGITMSGVLVGAAVGPPAFGALAQHLSYPVAWWAGAGALLAGSACTAAGRRLLLAADAAGAAWDADPGNAPSRD